MKKLMVVQCVAAMVVILWAGAWSFTWIPVWAFFPMVLTMIAAEVGLVMLCAVLTVPEGSKS